MSSEERSGWRDQWLSERHRHWGRDCPMLDIDCVYVEYDRHVPKLLVEYKYKNEGRIDTANHETFIKLADMASLPALGVRYFPNSIDWLADFEVTSLNARARSVFDGRKVWMSEIEYVELLYKFRGRGVPKHIMDEAIRVRHLRRPFTDDVAEPPAPDDLPEVG